MKVGVVEERWPLQTPFVIARQTQYACSTILVTVEQDGLRGRGEAAGVDYAGETSASMAREVRAAAAYGVADRVHAVRLLSAGGARNALDCALWDLEARRTGRPVWSLAGLEPPGPVETAFTLGLAAPEIMADAADAAVAVGARLLKLKLGEAVTDAQRVRAVRKAAPSASLVVDVNEGWSFDLLQSLAPIMADLGVELIEQPLPRGADGDLAGWASPVPLCADESCDTARDLPVVADRGYQAVNVKLDKAGGLTEALRLVQEAKALGLEVMVGNMLGTSLGMAPALLLAGLARWVDLDGPLLLARDREPSLSYERFVVQPFPAGLWG